MKRVVILILITAIMFAITGCGLLGGNVKKKEVTESTMENMENNSSEIENKTDKSVQENNEPQAAQSKKISVNLFFATEDNSAVKKEAREIDVKDKALLKAMVLALIEGPETEGLRQTIPEGTTIRGVNIKGNVAIVDFSGEYLGAQGLSEVTARVSLVNTLAQIDAIEKVRIMVDGKELIGPSGEPFGDMLPAALDADGKPIPGDVRKITIYFGNSNADKVVAEKRNVIVNKGDSIEKIIFQELMKGPDNKNLHAVVPKGTKLLSVKTSNGICTLDLSKEFVDNSPGGTAGESMTLNSIVNSLTELNTVEKVQFLIEGKKREVYTHAIFDEPLARNEDIIGK